MGLFTVRKPRGFRKNYIYYDERKEFLKELKERNDREMGLTPPEPFKPEDLRGKFVNATTHLRRRKEKGKKPASTIKILVAIFILIAVMVFLYSC